MCKLTLEVMFFGLVAAPALVVHIQVGYKLSSIFLTPGDRQHHRKSLVLTKGATVEYSHQMRHVPVRTTSVLTLSSMEMVVEHHAIMCQIQCIWILFLGDLWLQILQLLKG